MPRTSSSATSVIHSWLETAARRLEFVEELVVAVLLSCILVLVCGDVLARWVLDTSIPSALEISSVLAVYLVFVGSSLVVGHGESLRLGLVDSVSGRLSTVLRVGADVVLMAFLGLLVYFGVDQAYSVYEAGIRSTSLLAIPQWIGLAAVPIGGFLMIFKLVVKESRRCP